MTPIENRVAALFAAAALGLAPLFVLPTTTAAASTDVKTESASHCRRTLTHYPVLRPGARRPGVRTLQCAVNDLGLAPVVVDGWYGPQTKRALRAIVRSFEGTPAHPYRITSTFWTTLYGAQLPDRTLRLGDHGHAVRVLQRALRAWGSELIVDGDFGPQTQHTVEDLQQALQIRPSGRVDRDTRYMLGGGFYW